MVEYTNLNVGLNSNIIKDNIHLADIHCTFPPAPVLYASLEDAKGIQCAAVEYTNINAGLKRNNIDQRTNI